MSTCIVLKATVADETMNTTQSLSSPLAKPEKMKRLVIGTCDVMGAINHNEAADSSASSSSFDDDEYYRHQGERRKKRIYNDEEEEEEEDDASESNGHSPFDDPTMALFCEDCRIRETSLLYEARVLIEHIREATEDETSSSRLILTAIQDMLHQYDINIAHVLNRSPPPQKSRKRPREEAPSPQRIICQEEDEEEEIINNSTDEDEPLRKIPKSEITNLTEDDLYRPSDDSQEEGIPKSVLFDLTCRTKKGVHYYCKLCDYAYNWPMREDDWIRHCKTYPHVLMSRKRI